MTIGERLRIVRGSRSRREVAEMLDMKQQAWAVYEANRSAPGAKLLVKISKAFAVSVDWLLGIEENAKIVANNSAVVIGSGTATNQAGKAGEAEICRHCEIKKKLKAMQKIIDA